MDRKGAITVRAPFQALTIRGNGRLDRIISDVEVYPAFDPDNPPDPLPTPVRTGALWDTGASKSVIGERLVAAMSLQIIGQTMVVHANGQNMRPQYIVNFRLPNGVRLEGAIVTSAPDFSGFDILLGMDVITTGDFSITTFGGQTWMSFRTPSHKAVDFVEEHNKYMGSIVGRNDPCWCGSGEKFKRCHGK